MKTDGIQAQQVHWYPGHMAKTRRLIEENVRQIDVVVEIVDARIPRAGRNPGFDDMLKNKPRLIVLNKADLADEKVTAQWVEAYQLQGITVLPISCATGMNLNKIIPAARSLIQERIDREQEKGRKHILKLMMCGTPNVGKSSLINRLSGRAGAKTGDRPGVTKGKQWIRLRGDAELLDTPGILPQKFEDQETAYRLAFTGAIKDEIVNTELLSYDLLVFIRDHYAGELCARYKLENIEEMPGHELLEYIGRKRGFVISGGEIDTERAANMVLDEFRGCKIGRITLEFPE